MIYALNETILSDRYIPDLAYRDSNALVLIASENSKDQFIVDTATHYCSHKHPIILVGTTDEIASVFSTFETDISYAEDITYHDGNLEVLASLLSLTQLRRIHPIVIILKDLSAEQNEDTNALFEFIRNISQYHIQVYMFAEKEYDYLSDEVKSIADLEYFWDGKEEKNIMKLQFNNKK